MSENVIIVSHAETEFDADCAIAALADGGINAAKQYRNAPGGSTLFAMPGGMGFGATEGYDILVNRDLYAKAREILIGAGFAEPTDEENTSGESDFENSTDDEAALNDAVSDETTSDDEITPREYAAATKGSGLMMILFLVAAALFIIGVDKLIELIKSLF